MASYDRHGQHMYGAVHKAERKRWLRKVKAGGVCCWRCGKPVHGSRWDLGHVDEDGRARGFPFRHPECVPCNRRRVTHLRERLGEAPPSRKRPAPRFGGLPDPTPDNTVDRWSRHWAGGFNPRCPKCRERGSACDDASKRGQDGMNAPAVG
jgi:hypothetical protein